MNTQFIIAQTKALKTMDTINAKPGPEESPEDIIREMRESAAFNEQRFDRFPPEYRCWFNGEIVVARKSVAERLFGFADRIERALVRERAKARRKKEFLNARNHPTT